MRVLVVGGAGYVGSHTARALARAGHEAVIYDNLSSGYREFANGFELIVGDIRDHSQLDRALSHGCGAVLHFAAHAYVGESVIDPRKYFDNNVGGSLALLNAIVDSGVKKVIFSSTCATYGIPDHVPITDSTVQNPVNPYGASKLFFEHALKAYDRAYGLRSVILRYFNAAGADECGELGEIHKREPRLIPAALGALFGRRPPLKIFGDDYPTPDGTCIRDYVHVNDLAEGHVLALEYLVNGGESAAFNLGTGQGYSIREVMRSIEEVTGRKVPFTIAPRRPGDPPVLIADVSRTQRVLNWRAQRDLRDMVTTAWKWLHNKEHIIREAELPLAAAH
jgi:UDP-glucose-4-epimerase GalE